MNHFATPEFWFHYRSLPAETRELPDRYFAVLQDDPRHPSDLYQKLQDVLIHLHIKMHRQLGGCRAVG